MTNPRLVVDNPVTFTPSPYGILSVATPATPDNRHWQAGVTYQANCLVTNTTYHECIAVTGSSSEAVAPPEPDAKESGTDFSFRGALPFTIYAQFSCSPVGMGSELQRLATDALKHHASRQIEQVFATGIVAGQQIIFPHLGHDAIIYDEDGILLQSVPVTGSASDPAAALGFLENHIGDCYAGRGVIHIPRLALPTFDALGLIRQVGSRLQTLGGNLVVAGDGYTGTAPDGSEPSAGQTWIYATGMIFEMHGDIRVSGLVESFDRGNYTMTYLVEQSWLIGWDCCHAGIPVIIGCCGSAS
jgi:hypothetical protein